MKITRVCAWCKIVIGEIEAEVNDKYGCVTHGICPDCLKKQREKVENYKKNEEKISNEKWTQNT